MRTVDAKGHQLENSAADAYAALLSAARADGIAAPSLEIISAYRTHAEQERLWAEAVKKYGSEEKARPWVAPPGHSAHETGKAVDFNIGGLRFDQQEAMREHPAFKWLTQNAARYGFKPYDVEPWHWVYAGSLQQAVASLPTWAKVTIGVAAAWVIDEFFL